MSEKQKKIIQMGYVFYYLLLLAALFYCQQHQLKGTKMGMVAAFTCLLVPMALKIMNLKPIFEIYIINLIFCAVASIAGSMLNAYRIPYFDKVLHFSSGLFLSELSLMVFCYLNKKTEFHTKNEQILSLLFVNACNMMIAVFWEFFEYGCLIFLHNDAINHYTSGVHDSMTDMLVAFVGGLIISGHMIYYYVKGKKNFWLRLNDKFYEENFVQKKFQ